LERRTRLGTLEARELMHGNPAADGRGFHRIELVTLVRRADDTDDLVAGVDEPLEHLLPAGGLAREQDADRRRSALEMLRQEGLRALPGVARRIRTIGVALVAEEAVRRARVHDGLDALPEPSRLGLELLHGIERDERIGVTEEREHRGAQR